MAVPFGFSVGDFVAAIGVIAKVSKALKDSGGASDEYQHVLRDLQQLELIFSQLLPAAPGAADGSTTANPAIQTHVKISLQVLQAFLTRISKFEESLGSGAPRGPFHGGRRKAQWALHYSKEVDKLRKEIGTQVNSLNTLLGTENLFVFTSPPFPQSR